MGAKVLLTWVGAQDPWRPPEGRRAGTGAKVPATRPAGWVDGPILTLLAHTEPFSVVYVLFNPDYASALTALESALREHHPSVEVRPRQVDLTDPRHYDTLYRSMRAVAEEARAAFGEQADYNIFLSPGTPQMHAVWVLLSKTVFPANAWQASEHAHRARAEVAHIPFDIEAEILEPTRQESRLPDPQAAGVVYRSDAMRKVLAKLQRLATSDLPILIIGETGVGKERLARFVHDSSTRRASPYVHADCTSFTDSLIESELFGHVRGAFSGASRNRDGLVRSASNGTLFLDEIGELPLDQQAKLLRAIDEKTVRPVGCDHLTSIDVRFVLATHRDLAEAVKEGRFREDLYYRIQAARVSVPPLRERREDIAALAKCFLSVANRSRSAAGYSPLTLGPSLLRALRSSSWPGNVRQLKNRILSLAANAEPQARSINSEDLEESGTSSADTKSLADATKRLQYAMIVQALEENSTQAAAARALGFKSAQALQGRMRTLGIRRRTARPRKLA